MDQWEKVRFLVEHGFRFATVYDEGGVAVAYPDNLAEAREFVRRYRPDVPRGNPLKRKRS